MEKHIPFSKVEGAGNDFIWLDNRSGGLTPYFPTLVPRLCDRHFGIGADGVLLIEPSHRADYFMRYYNADGSMAEMCGNGGRAMAYQVFRMKLAGPEHCFETLNGIYHAAILGDQKVRLGFPEPGLPVLNHPLILNDQRFMVHTINTGVPHAVLFMEAIQDIDAATMGRILRFHPDFQPAGSNINFVQQLHDDMFAIRTYERGVGETLACGTGVLAAGLIIHYVYQNQPPYKLKTRGGDVLTVDFKLTLNQITHLSLTGPARKVFHGTFDLDFFTTPNSGEVK